MDTLPLFLGVLFFLFCLGVAFVYSAFIAKGKARWGGLIIALVGFIGLIPIAVVAPPLNPTLSSVSGTYEGDFGNGKSIFILRSTGSLDQTFTSASGKVYRNHGTWKIASLGEGGGIDFDHLLMPVDLSGQAQTPKIISFGNASLHGINGSIYFNEDDDISIYRVKR